MKLIYLINIFLAISMDSIKTHEDVDCKSNLTIGQMMGKNIVDILEIWPFAWTVLIEIQSQDKARSEENEGPIVYQPEGPMVTHLCSGSLLKPYLVLTSASCLQKGVLNDEVNVLVYGDYNRTEKIQFTKNVRTVKHTERKDIRQHFTCDMTNSRIEYSIRNIYYYNFVEEYYESDPDIAFIGLSESIKYYTTDKISVPIASPCHNIDYSDCQIIEVQKQYRFNHSIRCTVSFKNETHDDGYMQQSYKKEFGTLHCSKTEHSDTKLDYYGGNPVVCQIQKSNQNEYVQIGIFSGSKYTYLPDVINLDYT